ncbi:hypothetical protein ILUMI_00486 [Ignelater luminosus]|uniref:Uncharacterized protein n=1 Tax=Ignelater luminosus TaxID=2038154 RepID=A0A8K0DLI2_IGNLU|nr:hypothetical protein ILUMI_00486 [Ignelater luminosus]
MELNPVSDMGWDVSNWTSISHIMKNELTTASLTKNAKRRPLGYSSSDSDSEALRMKRRKLQKKLKRLEEKNHRRQIGSATSSMWFTLFLGKTVKPIEYLNQDGKKELGEIYLIPRNLSLLRASALNPELNSSFSKTSRNEDKYVATIQSQAGLGLAAVAKVLEKLINELIMPSTSSGLRGSSKKPNGTLNVRATYHKGKMKEQQVDRKSYLHTSRCSTRKVTRHSYNVTAIAYINKIGGIQIKNLDKLSREIWKWCGERKIYLRALYILSKENTTDKESRQSPVEIEYVLSNKAFELIVALFGQPDIDIFATDTNAKCKNYISWFIEQSAMSTDVQTLIMAAPFPDGVAVIKEAFLRKGIPEEAFSVMINSLSSLFYGNIPIR